MHWKIFPRWIYYGRMWPVLCVSTLAILACTAEPDAEERALDSNTDLDAESWAEALAAVETADRFEERIRTHLHFSIWGMGWPRDAVIPWEQHFWVTDIHIEGDEVVLECMVIPDAFPYLSESTERRIMENMPDLLEEAGWDWSVAEESEDSIRYVAEKESDRRLTIELSRRMEGHWHYSARLRDASVAHTIDIASLKMPSPGIQSLSLSPDGDLVGALALARTEPSPENPVGERPKPPIEEVAVFVWSAETENAQIVWRGEGDYITMNLMPGSTPDFALWDVRRGIVHPETGEPVDMEFTSFWYDGAEVREDPWRSTYPARMHRAWPERGTYFLTRRERPRILYEVDPATDAILNQFDLDTLPHAFSMIEQFYFEEGSDDFGPLVWLYSRYIPDLMPHPTGNTGPSFLEQHGRGWIVALSWETGEVQVLDTKELIHDSSVWNMAPPPGEPGVLMIASPFGGRTGPELSLFAATPLFCYWDIEEDSIAMEPGRSIMLTSRSSSNSSISDSVAWISSEGVLSVYQLAEDKCHVMGLPLDDYGRNQVLLEDIVTTRATSTVSCPSTGAIVTWKGFTFDRYMPRRPDEWASHEKIGEWTLDIDDAGEMRVDHP